MKKLTVLIICACIAIPAAFAQKLTLDKDAETYTMRGTVYFEKSDMEKAIAEYSQSIRINPNDPDPYKLRGMAYYQQKKILTVQSRTLKRLYGLTPMTTR